MLKKEWVLAAALLLGTTQVWADKADELKRRFNEFISAGDMIESVQKSPVPGLYEVVLKTREVVYVDEKFTYIFSGHIIQTDSRIDITQERLDEISRIIPTKLPLDRAIKMVHGDGSRFLVTFEDPNCGYCKRLQRDLQKVDNVTIYTFLVPLLGKDSERKSKNIWCAQDREAAWLKWILEAVTPAQADCESDTIEQNATLARQLGIDGTPTLIFASGKRIGGYIPPERMEEEFAAAASELSGADKKQDKKTKKK